MAAVLSNLPDEEVARICEELSKENPAHLVVAANYNCPGQLVISGTVAGIDIACERLKAAGAKRAMVLQVGGAFHSPLMAPAREELRQAIESVDFQKPSCPVYQNVNASAVSEPAQIKENLIAQLTAPVLWTQIVQAMVRDGASTFIESGPGKVLQGLVKKIHPEAATAAIQA